jgi:hypothetical protein
MAETDPGGKPGPRRQVYRCFLLRCRLEDGAGPGEEAAWRFTVERAGESHARRTFSSLEAATTCINDELLTLRRSATACKETQATS